MMSPQAFFYSNINNSSPANKPYRRKPLPSPSSPPAPSQTSTSTSPTSTTTSTTTTHTTTTAHSLFASTTSPFASWLSLGATPSNTPASALASHSTPLERKHDRPAAQQPISTFKSQRTRPDAIPSTDLIAFDKMGKRKGVSDHRLTPPSSPPSVGMSDTIARPSTASSAVEIPTSSKFDTAHKQHKARHHHADSQRRQHSAARRAREVHSPGSISPSMAALLAITSIPPPTRRNSTRQKQARSNGMVRMTVDSIVPRSQVSEKELSRELDDEADAPLLFGPYGGYSRSPMDVLLSPPEELEEDLVSIASDGVYTPPFSTRAASYDSIPSLDDSLSTTGLPSLDSPLTPRGGRVRPPRRSLEPVVSPTGENCDHPLSVRTPAEDVSFDMFDPSPVSLEKKESSPQLALKSVFKSNLTASLRALRSAARSLSSFTASSIPPEDFLTRSILTIDPRVPFTDERMPPVLDAEPSEAMRRYLNPTTPVRPEARSSPSVRSYTASIQMQTYKVQRSRNGPGGSGRFSGQSTSSSKSSPALVFLPGPRQREVRENSDFIRIAVLEHLMRKNGKFDDQKEGHARWVLPARKMSTKPYEIGPNGIPARWLPVSQEAAST